MIQYYVYELIDPRTNLPFYVGKGSGDRMYKHKKQAFQSKGSKINPYKSAIIRQIITEGYDLQYKKYKCSNETVAFRNEKQLITKYGRRCNNSGILTNLTNGGEGYSGGHVPVCQYNMFGEFIKQHRSSKDAAKKLKQQYSTSITSCCRGKERSAFGFLWSYLGNTPILSIKNQPVFQWDEDGNVINRYKNATIAAHKFQCDESNISKAIKNDWKSQGYIWSYTNTFPGILQNKRKQSVKHINSGKVYDSITKAAKATAHTVQSICAVCKGKRQKVGNDKFCYVSDSDQ